VWWLNPWEDHWRVHVRNPRTGDTEELGAALGLSPAEAYLTLRESPHLLPHWDRFSEGGGCYLADSVAEELGAKPGDRLLVAGRDLELIGVFDPLKFDEAARDLDDVIRDTLPFTVTERTAGGVLAFPYEYLDAHSIGAIGNFSTDELSSLGDWGHLPANEAADGQAPAAPDAGEGGERMGIETTVWLAPYDLGARQRVRITIRPTGDPEILELDLELTRGSGQVRSWWKLNRVFLADLRRQLLGWRNLRAERMLEYIAEAGSDLAAPVGLDSGA